MTKTSDRLPSVYVLSDLVGTRPTDSAGSNVCALILDDNYADLPAHVQDAYDAWRHAESDALGSFFDWGRRFLEACDRGGPWPTRRNGLVHDWWIGDKRNENVSIAMITLAYLHRAGAYGATANEVQRECGIVSGGFAGALATGHKAGIIARLQERR